MLIRFIFSKDGSFSTVDTLASTAVCGIIHSMFGGQPLLILGVAEPTVIMYTYLYNFTKEKADLGQELFLSWAECRFTRIAGELFGTLITVLFMQEAIKRNPTFSDLFDRWQRSFIADYGVPCMVLIWSLMSFGVPTKVPSGVPRRLFGPLPWESASLLHWTAILFNETITQTLLCGLIGLPPANGVLPQSPMHTKSLVVLKRQKEDGKECQGMHKQQGSNSEIYGRMQAVFIEMDTTPDHAVAKELKNLKDAVMKVKMEEAKMVMIWKNTSMLTCLFGLMSKRVSNLLQSLLVGALLLAMPAIKMIPTSILRGYFAYMALYSLPGNQFCERILLSFLLHLKDGTILEGDHASFVELMPFSYIAMFTLYQFAYLLLCFGITWIPIAGILFPTPFFLLIIIRQHLLPKLFHSQYLQELDAAEYEEIAGNQNCSQSMPFKFFYASLMHLAQRLNSFAKSDEIGIVSLDGDKPLTGNENHEFEISDAEILDELTTYNGELKFRSASFSDECL
ncbi:hypothetical protein TEA_004033 [Camellia sinensis var. sinensis]|uniref:Bicarbonate transporter-like transmembrane domain-containing protein n=1 Tax=Camellia sinensis var. sinensis TaxID=542762 RepID=A0A4S4ET07_CAMSN|nr:hypothetical protein TEA_004033 [Camellia sinensis var. sinensis]